MEQINCCRAFRPMCMEILFYKLSCERDSLKAIQLVREYFESEKGAVAESLYRETNQEEHPCKLWVNTTDEKKLYPQLVILCKVRLQELIKQEHKKFNLQLIEKYLNDFIEDWQKGFNRPSKLQQKELTEREKQYYEKAIKEGMAEKNDNGYKWLYNRSNKVSLAYFIKKIFCPKNIEQIPFKRLNNLWRVKRLDSAIDQLANAKTPQRWRHDIDKLFENNI